MGLYLPFQFRVAVFFHILTLTFSLFCFHYVLKTKLIFPCGIFFSRSLPPLCCGCVCPCQIQLARPMIGACVKDFGAKSEYNPLLSFVGLIMWGNLPRLGFLCCCFVGGCSMRVSSLVLLLVAKFVVSAMILLTVAVPYWRVQMPPLGSWSMLSVASCLGSLPCARGVCCGALPFCAVSCQVGSLPVLICMLLLCCW